eukprot:maker-scaffold5417_size4659-snap-gene-0.0 protein:Tk04608 transcript:maker-scaffold5417_size4659-snap-gene-0.0-mRNA-1 annotation:"2-oxoglutarate dehydrogenase component"
MNFALDYRMEFGRDVFIDLLGYRKYGHNEGDEPRFTQPQLYKAISKHENPRDIYAAKLLSEGIIDSNTVKEFENTYKNKLEEELESSREIQNTVITPFMQDEWKGFEPATEVEMMKKVPSGVDRKTLEKITATISQLPKGENFIRKVKKIIESRQTMFDEDKLDWAMGEHLAYGSLMMDGYNVRMSGQDVERGTFSHRHAVVKSENHENEFILHNHIEGVKGKFEIYNSHLSEYGVVGFEYGYALAQPQTLTIWEAQFGDFSNGAQIMMDQYISAGEDKWKNQNGLVKLLPHGYEGQGAEHSSARIERYLQLCARDNMFMANCTTPANMFHLLRRQMLVNYRKPLVVFTPKSLLRSPRAVSTVDELVNGHFQELIDVDGSAFAKAKTLVFVSGKFYYDLLEYREEHNRTDVALVRLEQLFPLPVEQMHEVMKKYGSKDVVWAQEEPRNMGAYSHLMLHMPETRNWRVCSRNMYATPASGRSGSRGESRTKLSMLRRKVAERLVMVKNETAMLTTFNEVDMKPIFDLRKEYKDDFKNKHGVSLGFMSFFTKAVTRALELYPAVNSMIDGKEMLTFDYKDISIAVSGPKGLMVPVIRNAENLSFRGIEQEVKRLALRARDGAITVDEMTGGTFTITNGGVFGSMMSTPIINPPQSAILGMHNIIERPVVVDGNIVARPMMYLAVSYDHRIIDGKES